MKNITLLISVVVCTYNRSSLLKNCIRSLEKQMADKKNYEVIVVDNNSKDNTKEIVRDYIKNKLNVRTVTEKNQGLSYARNRGWKEAKGKYVAYIDDDAIAELDWVEQIMIFIQKNPKIKAFGGPYSRFSPNPLPAWIPENYFTLNLGNTEKKIDLKKEWISGSNMIFNRSIFDKYGGFNTNLGMKGSKILYGEETELLIRLKKMEEAVNYVPNIRVKHLVAEQKLNLWWLLKNDYSRGFSISLINKNKLNLLTNLLYLIMSLFIFPLSLFDNKRDLFKRRVYVGLSKFFLTLGNIAGSIELIFK